MVYGYKFGWQYNKWSWNGYDGKGDSRNYECVKWTEVYYTNKIQFSPLTPLPTGTSYDLYLVQSEAADKRSERNEPLLHYVRTNKNPIIKSGFITATIIFDVEFDSGLNYNLDLTDIPVKDFYPETIDYYNSKLYTRIDKWIKVIFGCNYVPLLLLDCSRYI